MCDLDRENQMTFFYVAILWHIDHGEWCGSLCVQEQF